MKVLTGKAFCRLLEKHNWQLKRIKGSHYIYAKNGIPGRISVPVHMILQGQNVSDGLTFASPLIHSEVVGENNQESSTGMVIALFAVTGVVIFGILLNILN